MTTCIAAHYQIMGRNLKRIRQRACLSQNRIAQELGVSFQQIQKYEKGINRLPAEHIYTLKHYLNIPYEYFFQDLGEPAPSPTFRGCKMTESFIRKLETVEDETLKTKALRVLTILVD
jgi:transcriptional regulator with XRE-family HTH domain